LYPISINYKNSISSSSRVLDGYAIIGSKTYTSETIESLQFEDSINPNEIFEIGTTSAGSLEITLLNISGYFDGVEVKPYIGVQTADGNFEYVPLGIFYVEDTIKNKGSITLKCLDKMTKLESTYFTELSYPTTLTAIMNEICTKTGITFSGDLPNYTVTKAYPKTYREAVGFIAAASGGNAKFDRNGTLKIRNFSTSPNPVRKIDGNHYIDLNKGDGIYSIEKVTLSNETTGETFSSGELVQSGMELIVVSPWASQLIADGIFAKLNGLSYTPLRMDWQGDPALDLADWVEVNEEGGSIFNTILMDVKVTFEGGMTSEFVASAEGKNKNEYNTNPQIPIIVDDNSVSTQKIQDASITNAKIANLAVDTAQIQDAAITTAKIENLSVTSAKIADAAITTAKIEDASITSAKIGSAEIDTANIKNLAVTTAKIANLAVDSAKINDLAVTSAKIANLAVDTAKIQDLSVTNAKIANLAVGTAQIQDAAITTAKIGDAQITTALIQDAAITAAKILDATITNAEIANATITGAKIAVATIDTANIKDAAITTAKIGTGQITTALIANAAITETLIKDASITNAKIVSLDAGKMTTGTLDASKVNVTNLVADNIVTGTITIASSNLIRNTDWRTGTFQHWTNQAEWSVDTTTKYLGSNTAKCVASGFVALSWKAIFSEFIPCSPGEILTASSFIMTDDLTTIDKDLRMEIEFFDASNRIGLKTYSVKPSAINTWTKFVSTSQAAPTGTVKARLRIHPEQNGRFWAARPMLQKGKLANDWQPHTNELLADKGITNLQIGDSAVDNRVITANTITGDKLVVDAITTREIQAGSITAASGIIANATIGTAQIIDSAITTAKIGDAQITNAKIHSLDATKITSGFVDAARINANSITANHIASRTITANHIATGSITANEIASRTITADRIATGSLTANEIASGSITSEKLVVGGNLYSVSDNKTVTVTGGTLSYGGPCAKQAGSLIGTWSGAVYGHSMTVDLGTTYNYIKEISFMTYYAEDSRYIPRGYRIQTSTDNVNWTTQVTVEGNTTAGTKIHNFSGNLAARYVKMIIDQTQPTYTATVANFQVKSSQGNVEIHGGIIKADTVTATQINVQNLSAISADLGTVTAGTLKAVTLESVKGTFTGSLETSQFIVNGKQESDPSAIKPVNMYIQTGNFGGGGAVYTYDGSYMNLQTVGNVLSIGRVNSIGSSMLPKDITLFVDGGITSAAALRTDNGYLDVAGTKIVKQTDQSLRVENASGYVDIGAKNTSYAHIYTDRPSFYFNAGATFVGALQVSGNLTVTGDIGDNDWVTVTYQNSWQEYGTPYPGARYRKNKLGVVHLTGLVKGGTVGAYTPIFTLPVGYRPAWRLMFVSISNNAIARIDVNTDGVVSMAAGSNTGVTLDGITFKAA
jgi:uncharacterized protein YjbI with pentapeptide repeats